MCFEEHILDKKIVLPKVVQNYFAYALIQDVLKSRIRKWEIFCPLCLLGGRNVTAVRWKKAKF
jgi:hypothetical protein